MDEQKSKNDTPEENQPARVLPARADGIQQAKKEGSARHRNGGQSDHYIWGLSWYEFLTVVLGFIVIIAAALQWRADTIATRQKERPRIVFSQVQRKPDPPLSFSLIYKNVGETAALDATGVWLGGECQYTSSQECINWCLQPLPETRANGYGSILPQEEHTEEFFYTLKMGKARKTQRPIYFCGYFAYTDVFCIWRRQFYVVFYDPDTDGFGGYDVSNREEEAEIENCNP